MAVKKDDDLMLRIHQKTHGLIIGIDPGVDTGFAVWLRSDRKYQSIKTLSPYQAIKELQLCAGLVHPRYVLVRIEDARKRKVFGKADLQQQKYGAAIREGAGWAKAHSSLFEEVVQDLGFDYQLLAPRNTKWTPEYFKQVTGWKGVTSNHARDAASIVFQF